MSPRLQTGDISFYAPIISVKSFLTIPGTQYHLPSWNNRLRVLVFIPISPDCSVIMLSLLIFIRTSERYTCILWATTALWKSKTQCDFAHNMVFDCRNTSLGHVTGQTKSHFTPAKVVSKRLKLLCKQQLRFACTIYLVWYKFCGKAKQSQTCYQHSLLRAIIMLMIAFSSDGGFRINAE